MCSWVAESLLIAPELCCLGSDSLREAGGTAFGHRNTPPSSTTPCDQEPLFTWLSAYLALRFCIALLMAVFCKLHH